MTNPEVKMTEGKLPHWDLEGSTYFVTFRMSAHPLTSTERILVLDHLRTGNGRFYDLSAAVVLPDHVHVLLRPLPGYALSRVMKGIKGVSAHIINQKRGKQGTIWQDDYWDWIVRGPDEFAEKIRYMLYNPVKRGLVVDPWTWDGWYMKQE